MVFALISTAVKINIDILFSSCLYKYSWVKKENFSTKQTTDSLNVEDQWELLLKDADYSSYSVLALSPCHKIIAFGNLKGNIKLQDTGE